MPFEVTATRKRPQNFEQLAGQNFVAATLISSLTQGRIAHAYLFSGPRGCGKTSTARILAKALNCEQGPTPHPCGICASCREIAAGSSLDVIEIDGASNTSVDNIRQIKDEVLFAPNTGRYKIYIIDEVHMLSMSAFNALLKTIEEPPPYIIFIFATTEPQKVPATIKSRCQQFNFRLVPVEILIELLRQVAKESGIEAEDEALRWIAREAGGSVRDAYTLFDQIASFSGNRITAAQIRETLGLVGQDQLNTLFRALAEGNAKHALAVLDEVLACGVSPEQFLSDTVEYLRSVLLLGQGINKESLLSATKLSFDVKVLEQFSPGRAEYATGVLLDTYRHLKETVDPRYELELAIVKLSNISSYIGPAELFDTITALRAAILSTTSGQSTRRPAIESGSEKSCMPKTHTAAIDNTRGETKNPFQNRGSSAQLQTSVQQDQRAPAREDAREGALSPFAPTTRNDTSPLDSSVTPVSEKPMDSIDRGPLGDFRKRLIAALRQENPFLASALEKSPAWTPKHNGAIIPVTNKVELDLINRFSALISQSAAAIAGHPFAVEIRYEKNPGAQGGSEQAVSAMTSTRIKAPSEQPTTPNQALKSERQLDQSADTFRADTEIPDQNGIGANGAFNDIRGGDSTNDERIGRSRDRASNDAMSSITNPAAAGLNMSEHDQQLVSTIERLFKGKLVATTPPSSQPAIRQPFPVRPSAEPEDDSTDAGILEPEMDLDTED